MELRSKRAAVIRNALALYLGQAHFVLGDFEQAANYLENSLDIIADRAAAAMTLAVIYAKSENKEKEMYYFNKGLYWDQDKRMIYDILMKIE